MESLKPASFTLCKEIIDNVKRTHISCLNQEYFIFCRTRTIRLWVNSDIITIMHMESVTDLKKAGQSYWPDIDGNSKLLSNRSKNPIILPKYSKLQMIYMTKVLVLYRLLFLRYYINIKSSEDIRKSGQKKKQLINSWTV